MLIKKPVAIKASEITPKAIYLKRRRFIQGGMGAALATVLQNNLMAAANSYSTTEELTSIKDITRYNNFYEFGTSKGAPGIHAGALTTHPWSITVSGACEHPGNYDLDDLIKAAEVEERIYRLRCVEAWSMVIPWQGVPLGKILKRFGPTSKARYVAFRTLVRPAEMPGQRRNILDWPYREGLRMDEAMHPLTLLATGLYGKDLPNQNGAPIRLVVPWKYGFKSIKSIVSIEFTENEPPTTWNQKGADEYGFYANVNPAVDHPRWSQKKERRIGDIFKRPTLPFNGYAEEVASLYAGMDLRKHY